MTRLDVVALIFGLTSLPAYLANIYLLYRLVGAKKKGLFWGVLLVQMAAMCLIKAFAGRWAASIGIPIILITAFALGEGATPRRVLLISLYAALCLVAEMPANVIWYAATGTHDMTVTLLKAHLGAYAIAHISIAVFLLAFAWVLGPIALRLRDESEGAPIPFNRVEAAFIPFVLGQTLITYVNTTLRYWAPTIGVRYLLSEVLMMALFLVADVVLLGDSHTYERQFTNEMQAKLLTKVADSFMQHYRDIEARIVHTGKMRHDLKNQLQVADVLVTEGKLDEASSLLGDLSASLSEGEGETLFSVHLSKEFAESHEQASKGEAVVSEPVTSRNRYPALGFVLFVASQAFAVAVFVWHAPVLALSRWLLFFSALALAVWFLSDPILFKMLWRAREADISEERVRIAQEFLDARSQMGRNLEREASGVEELRRSMLAHVQGLEGLLAEGRIDEFHAGVVGEKGVSIASVRYCENSVADALTRVKADAAERAGVQFEAELGIPDDLALPPLELCTILSNIYDNAIKGAAAAPEDRRWVHVGAKVAAGYLIVVCKNGCAEDAAPVASARMRDGASGVAGLRTSRPGVQEHGWGLRILGEVADRLGGTLETSVEDGVFVTRVTAKTQTRMPQA